MSEKQRTYDVFISYSRRDQDWVSEFTAALHKAGINTWFDLNSVLPGERWEDSLEKALRESKAIVLVVSQDSLRSPWTNFELGAALADNKYIIPVLPRDVGFEYVPATVRKFQAVREESPTKAGEQVAQALKKVPLDSNTTR